MTNDPWVDLIVPVSEHNTSEAFRAQHTLIWAFGKLDSERIASLSAVCSEQQIEGVTSEFYINPWREDRASFFAEAVVDCDGSLSVRVDYPVNGEGQGTYQRFFAKPRIEVSKLREAYRAAQENHCSGIICAGSGDDAAFVVVESLDHLPDEIALEIDAAINAPIKIDPTTGNGKPIERVIEDILLAYGIEESQVTVIV